MKYFEAESLISVAQPVLTFYIIAKCFNKCLKLAFLIENPKADPKRASFGCSESSVRQWSAVISASGADPSFGKETSNVLAVIASEI